MLPFAMVTLGTALLADVAGPIGMEGGGIADGARTPSMVSSPERREVCRKGREYLRKGTMHG